MLSPDSLGLINEGTLLLFSQHLPLGAQSAGDLRIVHLWVFLGNLAPLYPGPDHESIHGTLDVLLALFGGR